MEKRKVDGGWASDVDKDMNRRKRCCDVLWLHRDRERASYR